MYRKRAKYYTNLKTNVPYIRLGKAKRVPLCERCLDRILLYLEEPCPRHCQGCCKLNASELEYAKKNGEPKFEEGITIPDNKYQALMQE